MLVWYVVYTKLPHITKLVASLANKLFANDSLVIRVILSGILICKWFIIVRIFEPFSEKPTVHN